MSLASMRPAMVEPQPASQPDWGKAGVDPGCDERLDRRTRALIGLAVAATLRSESQLRHCVAEARAAGTARDEIVAALLAAMPAAGLDVLTMIEPALRAFDEPYLRGQD